MTYIAALLLLTAAIIVHELGHLVLALVSRCSVEEFSIFIGPPLYKVYWNNIQFTLRLFPFGGYVMFSHPKLHPINNGDKYLAEASWVEYTAVTLAGVTFNLLSAVAVMWLISWVDMGYQSPLAILSWVFEITHDYLSLILHAIVSAPAETVDGNLVGTVQSVSTLITESSDEFKISQAFLLARGFWVVSLSIALLNSLPVPPLDGWHAAVRTMEFLIRRRISPLILNLISLFGVGLLLGLFLKGTLSGLIDLISG